MSDVYVYDKAKWHFDGDQYPEDLPQINAYTHGGFVLVWLLKREMLTDEFTLRHRNSITAFEAGKLSAGELYEATGGVLDSEMLTTVGNEFAEEYIDEFYLDDYEMLFGDDYPDLYEVDDNEGNQVQVSAQLDQAYSEWREDNS